MNRYSLRTIWLLLLLLLLSTVVPVSAQDDGCPVDVQLALEQSQGICVNIGTDQVCYGNLHVTAEPQPEVEQFLFEQPGDREDVIVVRSLSLSAMDPETNAWGIAHMRLLVNSAALEPAEVRLVLFGDVDLENQAENRKLLNVTVTVRDYINVRQFPYNGAGIVTTLAPGDTVTAIGRLADSSWLRLETEEDGVVGWVLASLVTVDGDPDTLTPESATVPFYSPMQAFLYSSGDTSSCTSAPSSGLLIQTPEGQARVTFLINEVSIDLVSGQTGSTAFIEAQPEDNMAVTVLQGSVSVTVGDIGYTAIAGSQITVPLGPDLSPTGSPTMPQPFDPALVEGLVSLGIDPTLVPPPPATLQMIYDANNPDVSSTDESMVSTDEESVGDTRSTDGGSTASDDGESPPEDPEDDSCPEPPCNDCNGASCEAPGHNK
jgi:hypothetical protein